MNPPAGFVDLVLIRCYECHRVISDKQLAYENLILQGWTPRDAMTHLGIETYCCREKFMNMKRYLDPVYKRNVPTAQTWREPGRLPFQTSEHPYKTNFIPSFDQKLYDELIDEKVDLNIIDKLEDDFIKQTGRRLVVTAPEEIKVGQPKVLDIELPF